MDVLTDKGDQWKASIKSNGGSELRFDFIYQKRQKPFYGCLERNHIISSLQFDTNTENFLSFGTEDTFASATILSPLHYRLAATSRR